MSTHVDVGDSFKNNYGSVAIIVERVKGSQRAFCRFKDGTEQSILVSNLRLGAFKNPNDPTVAGLGFMGIGKYSSVSHKSAFEKWYSIFRRVYIEIEKASNRSYQDAVICEDWYNFQNFAQWMDEQIFEDNSWHLDKDLLVKGNKLYSPDTCIFLPSEVNIFFTKRKSHRGDTPIGVQYRASSGKYISRFTKNSKSEHLGCFSTADEAFIAYKFAKEVYAKELATKWQPLIDPRAYTALMNYQVEITD